MKQEVLKVLKKALKEQKISLKDEEILNLIEVPKEETKGDFAFPCFYLTKIVKENPHEIALDLRTKIGNPKYFKEIQVEGPYINFHTDKISEALSLIKRYKSKDFGKQKNNKKTMIEFPSPNTNKPLHIGHLRNMSIGESVSRILEFNGHKVIRANLNNDRGIHICKSMAAYQRYGKNKKPNIKSDHFVGNYYVMFNKNSKKDKKLETDSHHLLQKYEEGDKKTIELWKKMNSWALEGFKKTYGIFGIELNKEYFESKLYQKGKEIVSDGLKKGIFYKTKDGAIACDLKDKKLGEKILIRSDGTSIYITQDIYLAKLKFENYKIDESIYVTGNEQNYHFNALFEILKKLDFSDKKKLTHLSYGMVNLPEGKIKSREGTIVDADDLIEELQENVKKEISKREKLSKKELESRSLKIALAAIKYFLLKVDIKKNMMFDPKKSISFEGDTGPYIQYSYARASSIIRKSKKQEFTLPKKLHEKEKLLIKKLKEFETIVIKSYQNMNPSLIANYAYDLSHTFNEFYHTCPVIGSDNEVFKIELIEVFRKALKNSLYLLGIETLEVM